MPDDVKILLDDLAGEHEALDALVAPLEPSGWDLATPSEGWRVRDQIGHLAFFDDRGTVSCRNPEAFEAERDEALADFAAFSDLAQRAGRQLAASDLLAHWRDSRSQCLSALTEVPADVRLPWYGPPMSVRSFATARLMETWAHGQDVLDGLAEAGVDASRPATDRLRHICHIGFATRGWSYAVRGAEAPAVEVRVELALPSRASWTAGPESAADVVRGSAEDFCLVVTQRRNVDDTALEVIGDAAASWMQVAQCFAGAPTLPPAARRVRDR